MSDPDPKARLEALEAKLAAHRAATAVHEDPSTKADYRQADLAWRMVIEMVSGLGIGFGIGFGLDTVLGTKPWLMLVFTLLGIAAGINVMLRTAREAQEKQMARSAAEPRDVQAGSDDSDGASKAPGDERKQDGD